MKILDYIRDDEDEVEIHNSLETYEWILLLAYLSDENDTDISKYIGLKYLIQIVNNNVINKFDCEPLIQDWEETEYMPRSETYEKNIERLIKSNYIERYADGNNKTYIRTTNRGYNKGESLYNDLEVEQKKLADWIVKNRLPEKESLKLISFRNRFPNLVK